MQINHGLRIPEKSGNPCPRLIALCFAAKTDMTVNMVVPTLGRRLGNVGVVRLIGYLLRLL